MRNDGFVVKSKHVIEDPGERTEVIYKGGKFQALQGKERKERALIGLTLIDTSKSVWKQQML